MAKGKLQLKGMTKAIEFIKDMVGEQGEVIKAVKTEKGWDIEIEVVEQSKYMKKIGIPRPVYDKNVYRVVLNREMDPVSYERKEQRHSQGAVE